uniref:CMP-sialic acid transporter n=1 Tax=Lygus hesperus TaxID=30085 RepID=A0A0A9XSN5_LYGHE
MLCSDILKNCHLHNYKQCAQYYIRYLRSYRFATEMSLVKQIFLSELSANGHVLDIVLISLPAIIYVIQNSLSLQSLKLVDPAMVQIIYQLRIPFTAILMKLLLKTRISCRK